MAKKYKAVVVGVSAGGLEALKAVFSALKPDFSLPLLIVQHTGPDSDDYLARFLDTHCSIRVKEAEEKEKIEGGCAYIAPANYHLLVEEDKTLSLSVDAKVNFARPSVDVLFESAADVFGSSLIALLMTGANNDGASGMKYIKECGGLAIVQDPATAEVPQMPLSAIEAVKVDHVLPLNEIGGFLNTIAG